MTCFIGVDLHKDNFTACFYKTANKPEVKLFEIEGTGLNDFRGKLRADDQIAVEATGNTAYFVREVESFVSKVVIVPPSRFQIITKSTKKNDKNDAEKLALYLSKGLLPEARLKSKESLSLLSMLNTREQLCRAKKNLINKTHSILQHEFKPVAKRRIATKKSFERLVLSIKWHEPVRTELEIIYNQICSLSDGIKKLEKQIDIVASNMKGYENLISIKGIAPLSAAILLSVIDNIDDFDKPGQLASYFGIVPVQRESNNKSKTNRISKRGSKMGRSTLVICSTVARQYSPYLKDFHNRIKERRTPGKAMIASARKFLVIIYHTLKNDWVFDDFANFKYHVRETSD